MSVPPSIAHRLASATERTGTRAVPPGQGDKEDTAEIVTLPTRVTFQPGTTVGRIFAKRPVLMDLQPGIVSDFLLSVFHTNPTLKTMVLRLNSADFEKVRAGVDPYVPQGKHDKSDNGYYVGQGDVETSGMQARGFAKALLVFQEHALLAKHKELYPVKSLPTLGPIAFQCCVEGVTTLAHASGTFVSISLQGPLHWLGDGDQVVIRQRVARFVRNTDPSKLD